MIQKKRIIKGVVKNTEKPFHFHKITKMETFIYSLNDLNVHGETTISINA